MVSEQRLERAMKYLAETDESAAELRANVERTEFKAKQVKAAVFHTGEGTVSDREAAALVSEKVSKAYDEHFKAMRDYHAVANKRALEILVVELWRSINANRRVGNV